MVSHVPLRLAIGLLCLTLASCAAIKEKTTTEPAGWSAQQLQRQQMKVWEIRGRLGVQTQTTGGSMDLIWKQSAQDYSIRLIMPLGAGQYFVQGDDHLAKIRLPDGREEIVNDIDNSFLSVLGVNLPVNAIRDWIRGLPARALSVENIQWDEQGQLSRLQQSGWTVEMTRYAGEELLLPHAIYLSRQDNAELDIRLVLRQWQVIN